MRQVDTHLAVAVLDVASADPAAWRELAAALKDGRPAAGHVQSVRDAEARALDNQ